MNTPRMKNHSILSLLPLLHSTSTIQLIFLKYFHIFSFFYATPSILPGRRTQDSTKRPPENDRRPAREPEVPTLLWSHRSWRATPAVLDVRTKSTPRTAEPTAGGWMALAAQNPLDRHRAEKAELPPKGVLDCTATENPRCITEWTASCPICPAPPLHNRWFPLTLGTAEPTPLDPVNHPGKKTP